MKITKASLLLVSLVLASSLILSACSALGVVFSGNQVTVNINMQEDQINELLASSTSHSDDRLLDEITSIDMQDGLIRVFGSKNQPNGSKASGSYDVSMGQTDGDLWVEVVAIDIPGIDITDPVVTRLNNQLAHDFSQMAVENHSSLSFRTVEITQEALKMVVEVQIDK